MIETPAEARRQQRLEELCAVALRALTGDARLHYGRQRLWRGLQPLPLGAPHLRTDPQVDDFDSMRGAADGVAMRLLASDRVLHLALAPAEPVQRFLFELLEQLRCESLAELPGMKTNLRHRHETWSQAFHRARLTETATGLVLYAVVQIARARITGEPVLEATEDMIEGTRGELAGVLGVELAQLRALRHDQRAFAEPALAIARHVAAMVERVWDEEAGSDGAGEGRENDPPRFALWIDNTADDPVPAVASPGGSGLLAADAQGYRVYTRAYDRESAGAALGRAEELQTLRQQLDDRIARQGTNLPRLSRELQALLSTPAETGWDSGHDEGRIDGRRLARLIASPTERRVFQLRREEPVADTAVTLLLDCSGSMKVHAESLALVADVLMRALEQAGAAAELLGFTTNTWSGGRAARDWQRARRPAHPGRLNELHHMVFKDAERPWRRSRASIAALLKPELYRESVDGEAIDWACERLLAQDVQRRVLVVVSDGCPMDTATAHANDAGYLDQHLQQVVARREREGRIAIAGLGLGLDLGAFYRTHRIVDIGSTVRDHVFHETVALIAEAMARMHRR